MKFEGSALELWRGLVYRRGYPELYFGAQHMQTWNEDEELSIGE